MSVLIRGIEMPQGNSTINVLIYADGTVYTGHVDDSRYSAVSVPTPHGRLIDADAMCNDLDTVDIQYAQMIDWCISVTEAQPTIIEAEGSDT